MDQQQPQKNLAPKSSKRRFSLTPEELAKAKAVKQRHEAKKLTPELQLVAEFGYYYGWEAVRDVLKNNIDLETMLGLLYGARKVWYRQVIDGAVASQVAFVSANSKSPQSTFNKGMAPFMKEIK